MGRTVHISLQFYGRGLLLPPLWMISFLIADSLNWTMLNTKCHSKRYTFATLFDFHWVDNFDHTVASWMSIPGCSSYKIFFFLVNRHGENPIIFIMVALGTEHGSWWIICIVHIIISLANLGEKGKDQECLLILEQLYHFR